MQARLASSPQHIFLGLRPLLLNEITHLALGEAGTVVLAKRAVAQHSGGKRAVAVEYALEQRGRKLRIARAQLGERSITVAEAASRQRRARGPVAFHARKIARELLHRVLGQAAVGGDLAAEHRKYGRCALDVVQAQRVVARYRRTIGRAVIVKRAHPAT